MRFLHTADWHIGQSFYEYDRRNEHIQFFDWLKKQTQTLHIDALLIAGDIFDSPNPSAESQKLFYTFLKEITTENPELLVIIIAGNHDSAARLEAPNPLLEGMNIIIRGTIKKTPEGEIDVDQLIIPYIKEGETKAYFLAVPYLRQGDYPKSDNYAEGVKAMYEAVYNKVRNTGKPIIAMGHLQATGSEISENDRSERTIIGGLECISPEAFDQQIVYTALGHLHRSQRVSKRENIRYSGAPLPMSFAEKNNKHGAVLVEIENETTIKQIEFEVPVKLMSIPPTALPLSEVISCIQDLPDGDICTDSPFLEIKVLITEPEPSLRHQIEEEIKNKSVRLARIEAVTLRNEADPVTITFEELQTINPEVMAERIFEQKYGGEEMPENMKQLLRQVIREVER